MQFTTALLAALSLGATLAAPAQDFHTEVMPEGWSEQPAEVYNQESTGSNKPAATAGGKVQALINVWESPDFIDLKFTGSAAPGDCVNFEGKWNDRAQSGKAQPGFICTVWFDKNCKGQPSFSFNAKGSPKFPSEVRSKGSSWKCKEA